MIRGKTRPYALQKQVRACLVGGRGVSVWLWSHISVGNQDMPTRQEWNELENPVNTRDSSGPLAPMGLGDVGGAQGRLPSLGAVIR